MRWGTRALQFSVVREFAEGNEDVVEEGGGDCRWIGSQLAISVSAVSDEKGILECKQTYG